MNNISYSIVKMTGRCFTVLSLCVCVWGAPSPQLIDLGYPLNENTEFWPGLQPFNITSRTRERDQAGIPWFAINTFESPEHVGTHLDAPFHFVENGWKLGDIPSDRFFVPGVLIDVSGEVNGNNGFQLLPSHIEAWEEQHGIVTPESVVLIRFGWAQLFYGKHDKYYGLESNDSTDLNFPGLSKEAAELLVSRKVYGVGLDTGSLDPGSNAVFEAHRVLLGASIFGLENLNLTSNEIPEKDFMLHVMPMKISEGTGAPTRVIAFVNPRPSKEKSSKPPSGKSGHRD